MRRSGSPVLGSLRAVALVPLLLLAGTSCKVWETPPRAVVEVFGPEFVTESSGFPQTGEPATGPELRGAFGAGAEPSLLEGVNYAERRNRPCRIKGLYRFHAPSIDEWEWCGGNGSSLASSKSVRFDEPGLYVRSIRVCANDGNHRIKGIEIWGARLTAAGVELVDDAHDWHQRPNCNHRGGDHEWRERRSCPTGYVAKGLVVSDVALDTSNVDDYSDLVRYATGLALICQQARLILGP